MKLHGSKAALDAAYVRGTFLGKGSFGRVFVVTCRRTGERYACKEFPDDEDDGAWPTLDWHRETTALDRLAGQPGIVQMHGMYADRVLQRCWLVMDLADCTLDKWLSTTPGSTRRAHRWHVGRSLVAAIATCHAAGIVHRDVAPKNVLLQRQAETWRVLLADFGTARTRRPGLRDAPKAWTPRVVQIPYRAPELVTADVAPQHGPPAYLPAAVDMWSWGCMWYQIAWGGPQHLYWCDDQTSDARTVRAIFHRLGRPAYLPAGCTCAFCSAMRLPSDHAVPDLTEDVLIADALHRAAIDAFQQAFTDKDTDDDTDAVDTELRAVDALVACLALDPARRPTAKSLLQHCIATWPDT